MEVRPKTELSYSVLEKAQIENYEIDMCIVGDEYKEKDFMGRLYCEAKGIELYFNTRDHRFSSSGLRREVHQKELNKNDN